MANRMIDIALGADEDLLLASGDFYMSESTAQHQYQLILNNKGDFKQHPDICVGVTTYMDDEQTRSLTRAISLEFAKDGMDVKRVVLGTDGVISSDAYYP